MLSVVIEGMDGSGKSTLARTLADQTWWPLRPMLMAFPSRDGEVGRLIRRSFSGEAVFGDGLPGRGGTRDKVLGYLMVADGIDREHLVRAHVASGTPVVMDRHAQVSGWVYQTECMDIDQVLALQQRWQFFGPTLTFILDLPAEVAITRIHQRGEVRNPIYEREGIEYVDRLRKRYLAYASMHDNVEVLGAEQPVARLIDRIHGRLNKLFSTAVPR